MELSEIQAYYNRFKPTSNYKKLLFIADKNLQSAELNDLQEIIYNQLNNMSKFLIKDGTIINGGSLATLTNTLLVVNEATIYANGTTFEVAKSTVVLQAGTTQIVGVQVKEVVVTDAEDPEIREPYPGPNIGVAGSYRLKIEPKWIVADNMEEGSSFVPVFTISNGTLVSTNTTVSTDETINLISQYDKDTRGSYTLEGYNLRYLSTDSSTNVFRMLMTAGSARILGKAVSRASDLSFNLEAITDTRTILGEPLIYSGSKGYDVRNPVIQSVIDVQGIKEITATVTHGAYSGASDILPNIPVAQILEVKQGGTTFVQGTDYVQTGDAVDWSPAGAEPSPGSTYEVKFRYIYTFSASANAAGTQIVLTSANVLVTGSTFYVSYRHYLDRIDRVNLDDTGTVVIIKGTSSTRPSPPKISPSLHSLATVYLSRNKQAIVSVDMVVNVNMRQMKILQDKVADIQYNVARLTLMENARSYDPTTTKKNLIVDPLFDDDMRDTGQTNTAVIKDRLLQCGSNLSSSISSSQSYFLPRSYAVALKQDAMTGSRKINPYATSGDPRIAKLTLTPNSLSFNRWWWEPTTTPAASTVRAVASLLDASEAVEFNFLGINYNVTADAQGVATRDLTVPAGTVAGSYTVKVTGLTSGSTQLAVVRVGISVTPQPIFNWDPIAQTFFPKDSFDLHSVSVYVTELPTDTLAVKVVDVRVGLPDRSSTIASGTMSRSQVVLGWNTVELDTPVRCYSNMEYAFIVLTGRPQGSVGIAKLGGYDTLGNKWVRTQTYEGVCLVSANESTWTPIQDEDMTFRLNKAVYSASQVVTIATISNAANMTDWVLNTEYTQPPGTSIRFFLYDGKDEFDLTPDALTRTGTLSTNSGGVTLRAELKTSDTSASPIIYPGTTLTYGTGGNPSVYTMRSFAVPNADVVPATITVLLDQVTPSGSAIAVEIEVAEGVYQNAAKVGTGIQLGDGRIETTYRITNVTTLLSQLRITLSYTDPEFRPDVSNIRIMIS